jgi:hypothetical protein
MVICISEHLLISWKRYIITLSHKTMNYFIVNNEIQKDLYSLLTMKSYIAVMDSGYIY